MHKFFLCWLIIGHSLTANALDVINTQVNGKVTIHVDGKFTEGPKLDILFVVDNSGSMSNHQQSFIYNMAEVINKLENLPLDFQAGVITTDNKQTPGKIIGSLVNKSTPHWQNKLKQNLLVGTNGDYMENFFKVTLDALTSPLIDTDNKGVLRPDSYLSIVFISDGDATSAEDLIPLEFVYRLNSEVRPLGKILLNAFVIKNVNRYNCAPDDSLEGIGAAKILEAIRLVNQGRAYELCDDNIKSNIDSLSETMIPNVSFDYKPTENLENITLIGTVDSDTIEVTFGNQNLPNDNDKGWTFDANTNQIRIGRNVDWQYQPAGTTIDIHYKLQEDSIQ
ncbi:MAG: VWA domain-containing protein [Bdellovibrionales bacterium]|nr:VWA domain-containing protein [Bdellovibrionales bacterium]